MAPVLTFALFVALLNLVTSSFVKGQILGHELHTTHPDSGQYVLSYEGPEMVDYYGWTDRVWCDSHMHDLARWKQCMAENLPVGIGPYDDGNESHNRPKHNDPIAPDSSKGTAALPIEVGTIGGNPYFTTNLALGEPPQVFRVVFDLTSPGLYVRSASCPYEDCGPQDFSYNGSLSATRKTLGHRFRFLPDGWVVEGTVSEEMLHLVSIQVPNITIGEIDKYYGPNLYYYVLSYVVDGALGLAPPSNLTSNYLPYSAPNPLYSLFSTHNGTVARKVFTISIPTQLGEQGSLTFGSYPKGYTAETPRVPLMRITSGKGKPWGSDLETWHVPITSIAFNGSVNLNITFPSTYARLELGQHIGIPAGTVYKFYKAIEARRSRNYDGALVDCDKRDDLPDLVLGIGGHNVVLTKDDYSFERKMFGRPFCLVNIVPSNRVVTIGSLVMRKLDLVFDLEGGELALMSRKK